MAEQTSRSSSAADRGSLPQGVVRADIGIRGETIAAIGEDLGPGALEIDASDRLVLPGGIDPHAHIEQVSGGGLLNADTFESATTSAAFGGTTTVIPFAAQHIGMQLDRVVADYHRAGGAGRRHRLRVPHDPGRSQPRRRSRFISRSW